MVRRWKTIETKHETMRTVGTRASLTLIGRRPRVGKNPSPGRGKRCETRRENSKTQAIHYKEVIHNKRGTILRQGKRCLPACVAVCLFDPAAGVGGLCHFVLPAGGNDRRSNLRFGRVAVPELIRRVFALGAVPGRLRAKLFGGACVVVQAKKQGDHLGLKNARLAEQILAEERIAIIASDLGGERGRKLVFHPDDGAAWVRAV